MPKQNIIFLILLLLFVDGCRSRADRKNDSDINPKIARPKNGPGQFEFLRFRDDKPFGENCNAVIIVHTMGPDMPITMLAVGIEFTPGIIKWWSPGAISEGVRGHFMAKAYENLRPTRIEDNDSSATNISQMGGGGGGASVSDVSGGQGGVGGTSSAITGPVNAQGGTGSANATGGAGTGNANAGAGATSNADARTNQSQQQQQNQAQRSRNSNRNRNANTAEAEVEQ